MVNIMNKKEFLLKYISITNQENSRCTILSKALNQLGGAGIDLISIDASLFYDNIITQLIGEANSDWINWWLYETSDFYVIIDDIQHMVDTPEKLIDICIDLNAINNIVESF